MMESYILLHLNYRRQSADIRLMEKIPNVMSGTQIMIITDLFLSKLHISHATMFDDACIDYEGCLGKEEHIALIDLFAIQGKTQGFFERFKYYKYSSKQYSERLSKEMIKVHNHEMPATMTFQGVTFTFGGHKKLGDVLSDYWDKDKCTFSKIYGEFREKGLFEQLMYLSGGKEKVYPENANRKVDIFYDIV